MAPVGHEAVQVEPRGSVRPDAEAEHPGWRPAGAVDDLGELFAGMEILARSVRDTVRQLQDDGADDTRIALVEALAVALRTHGKAENDYAVYSSAVKVARKDEDTWEQLTSAYRRYIAPSHAKLAASRGARQLCFVRYRGSRERLAAFQLWVRTGRGQGTADWPPFILDYPIREAVAAEYEAAEVLAGPVARGDPAESIEISGVGATALPDRDSANRVLGAALGDDSSTSGGAPHTASVASDRLRVPTDHHDRLIESLHARAALAGWTTGLALVFAMGSLLMLATIGAADTAFSSGLAQVLGAIRSLIGDFNNWSIR